MEINGEKVVDAKKAIVLTITPKDIAKGNTKDSGACAAAQAACRQLVAEAARVHIGRTYVKMEGKWIRYQTSKPLRSEIIAFDRGGSFEPGEYTLKPLQPSKHAVGKRQGSNKPGARDKGSASRKPKKSRTKYHTVSGVRAHGANR